MNLKKLSQDQMSCGNYQERATAILRKNAERATLEAAGWNVLADLVEQHLVPGSKEDEAVWALLCRRFLG